MGAPARPVARPTSGIWNTSAVRCKVAHRGDRVVLIALVALAVTLAVVATAIAVRAVRIAVSVCEAMEALEADVMAALDVLDAEIGQASQARQILERAQRRRGGTVYVVPAARWIAKRGRENKRVTGVLVALVIASSAAVATYDNGQGHEPSTPRATVMVASTTSSTTTLDATTEPPAKAPSSTVPSGSVPAQTTSTTVATTTTTTAAPLSGGELVEALVALQLRDELDAGVVGQAEVHDLTDVIAAEVRDDVPEMEDVLDVIERCIDADSPASTEDCTPAEATEPLD